MLLLLSGGNYSAFVSSMPICNIGMVNKAFNLPLPTSMTNMFGNWLRGVPSALKAQIRVGVCDLL